MGVPLKKDKIVNTVVKPATLEALKSTLKDEKASERVRARLVEAGARWHANDNISEYIEEGELHEIEAEVALAFEGVLDALVIDRHSDHNTIDTARRVAKMYVQEVFAGRFEEAPKVTDFPNASLSDELMLVGPITVRSACSHHFVPMVGKVWIGIVPDPDSKLIGLSKYNRLTNWVMSRPQIQEESLMQLADLLVEKTAPKGVALKMVAEHLCMTWRGVKDADSQMTSLVMRGEFEKDATLRREFLDLCTR